MTGTGRGQGVLAVEKLGFPFDCDSPFLFAVHHLDRYPPGDEDMGPGRRALAGRRLGSDFGHPSGWSMYHGEKVPGFPKHPHRGFETITVTRQGYIDHMDSLGCAGRFGHGDVQWMTAGSGINHSEMFPLLDMEGENVCELFQIWINLPRASKMVPASFKMLWAEDLRACSGGALGAAGVDVALVAGELPGFSAPPAPPPNSFAADPASGVLVLTLRLAAGAAWVLPGCASDLALGGLRRSLYFYAGATATIGGEEVSARSRVRLRPDSAVELAAGPEAPAEFLLLQGREIGEPVVQHGPFVGSTREDIAKAFQDYQRTGFGSWPWPSGGAAHPRERQRFAQHEDGTVEEKPLVPDVTPPA